MTDLVGSIHIEEEGRTRRMEGDGITSRMEEEGMTPLMDGDEMPAAWGKTA